MVCFLLNLLNNKSINVIYKAHPAEAPMAIPAILPFPVVVVGFCSEVVSVEPREPLFELADEPESEEPGLESDTSRPVNGILLSIKAANEFSVCSGFLKIKESGV